MPYLTRSFVLGALGRRKGVEQFVGPVTLAGVRGIRWVSVWPWQDGYNVSVHDVRDLDDEHYRDMSVFPPLDAEDEDDTGSGRDWSYCSSRRRASAAQPPRGSATQCGGCR
jgi:hypothetical protein